MSLTLQQWWAVLRLWWDGDVLPWVWQVLVAADQLGNAVIGGWADETISSRAWRLSSTRPRWEVARVCIDAVFRVLARQRQHCFEAYTSERLRLQQPPELRS